MTTSMDLSLWETLRLQLSQPEYIHVMLHPLPIYGFGFGIFALLVALFLRDRRAEVVGLLLILVAALSAWPTVYFGEAAYDGVLGTLSLSDKEGAAWLDEHLDRGTDLLWVFHTVAAVTLAALILPIWLPKAGRPLAVLALLGAIVALGCGAWIGYAGGKIRHKEFRYGPPAQLSAKHDS